MTTAEKIRQIEMQIAVLNGQHAQLRDELMKESDGYLYVTQMRIFGNVLTQRHHNAESVQMLCNEFYGDNGIVDVYTTNPHHNITTWCGGCVMVCTEEDINEF